MANLHAVGLLDAPDGGGPRLRFFWSRFRRSQGVPAAVAAAGRYGPGLAHLLVASAQEIVFFFWSPGL